MTINGKYYDDRGREAPDPFHTSLQSFEDKRRLAIERSDLAYANKPQELKLRRKVRRLFPEISLPGDRPEVEDQTRIEPIEDGDVVRINRGEEITDQYIRKRWKITDFKIAETDKYNIYMQACIDEILELSSRVDELCYFNHPGRPSRVYIIDAVCKPKDENSFDNYRRFYGLMKSTSDCAVFEYRGTGSQLGVHYEPISTPRKPFTLTNVRAREVKKGKSEDDVELIVDMAIGDLRIKREFHQYPGRYQPSD